MNFNEYQESARKYDTFSYEDFVRAGSKVSDIGVLEKVLGIAGEAGEACDKIKKIIRDNDGVVTDERRLEIVKEFGDVLWYLAIVSRYLGVEFNEVAEINLKKLEDRFQRNQIHGAGDNR